MKTSSCVLWAALHLLLPCLASAVEGAGRVSWKPYVFEADGGKRKAEAEIGSLRVPASRKRPGSGVLELSLVRFKGTSSKTAPPIFYLAGGPGGSAVETARGPRFPLFMALRGIADVIVLDQRGTGMSAPSSITCRQSWSYAVDRPGDLDEMLALARSHSRACAELMAGSGIDLAAYNNEESADDLEDLRRAIGAPKVSLLGISYGTQLALQVLRRHPGSVHRAVLIGVKGPDHTLRMPDELQRQLEQVDRLVREDPAARAMVPDFLGSLRSLLDRLEKQPVTVEVFDRLARRTARVQAGKLALQRMTARALGSLDGIRRLPATIHALTRGDFSSLGESVYRHRNGWLGSAMPYAVNCSAGVSPGRLRRILEQEKRTLLGRTMDFPFPEVCDGWRVPDLGEASRSPVRSEVPALFLNGTLDARTPVSNMVEVGAGFPNGVQVVVENGGHGDELLLASPEIPRLVLDFLKGEPRPAARIVLPPPRFEPPEAQETAQPH